MSVTIFLAQLFGIILILKGLFVLLRPKEVHEMIKEAYKSRLLTFALGMIIIIAGAVLVMGHNLWSTLPEIVVSLIIWGMLLKGILTVFAPKVTITLVYPLVKDKADLKGFGILILLLGFYLLSIGFGF